MRRVLCALLLAAVPFTIGCTSADEQDLGSVVGGKADSTLIDKAVIIPAAASATEPGEKSYVVHATSDFEVTLVYDGDAPAKLIVDETGGPSTESPQGTQPTLTVQGDGTEHIFHIHIQNFGSDTLHAQLRAVAHGGGVTPELIAAARANLDRVTKEIDVSHLGNYKLSGSLTDQFMTALSQEYEVQHPEMYAARVRALASMAFFALPDVLPPTGGNQTPFHGLDMDQFSALISDEDQVFSALVAQNAGSTNGVRPFSVCETRFIIETYVRPRAAFPAFDAYKAAYTAYADSCPQKDKDEWYNFRGLGGLRPSWVESNLADRFLRREVKGCATATSHGIDCQAWTDDRFGYRQRKNRELAARTLYYAPDTESYVNDPNNPLVFLEDRNGDGVGEWLRPGPATLTSGAQGTLLVQSSGQFGGFLKFQGTDGTLKSVGPASVVAEDAVDSRWQKSLLATPDMGLMTVFADSTGCTAASLDPAQCPLLRRFYSMIDRHENFYQTFSALTPTYSGISSQPSPLVASSITLGASHQWDSAGTPSGGSAGFIFLMRIPFKDIVTGNETSVATIMPGPKTTSIQALYRGEASLDFNSAWLDIASLSNNQYETEHEISAFGAVPAGEIEGILVVRKPAAVP
jgi:hypothetical protein